MSSIERTYDGYNDKIDKNEIFNDLVKITSILWEDDDLIDQDSLFKVQEDTVKLLVKLGNELNKAEYLIKKCPFICEVKDEEH